jgi:hypothetical protein
MTESKTEKSAKRGGLAWEKARRVPFLSPYAKGLTDWPDAFSPKDLAALQYPAEAADPERIRAMRNRNALTASLTGLVEDGDIPAVTVNYIPPAPKVPAECLKVVLHDDPWMNVDTDWMDYRPPLPLPPSPQPIEFKAIGRKPFAAYLHGQGEEPSEHIRVWLGPDWPARDAGQQGNAISTEPSKDKRDKIREHLKRMASHAPGFDSDSMPGQKIDFHALLAILDADFLVEPDTFDGYLKKPDYLCKFARKGRAPDFYEALADRLGANSGKYLTALKKLEPKYEELKRKRRSGAA